MIKIFIRMASLTVENGFIIVSYLCNGNIEAIVEKALQLFSENYHSAEEHSIEDTEKQEKHLYSVAKLYQTLEWLHPYLDGEGRTDLLFMHWMLSSILCPAILTRPYFSSVNTLEDWARYLKKGLTVGQAVLLDTAQKNISVFLRSPNGCTRHLEALNVYSRDNYTADFNDFAPDYIEKARFAIKASLIEWMTHKADGDVIDILTHLVGTYPLLLPQDEIDYEVAHILSLLNEEHKWLAQLACFASDWKNQHKFSTTGVFDISEIFTGQSLLKNRPRESIKPDFSQIAKQEAKQGNIEGALDAASHINERLTEHSDTLEYIADVLVERGEVERAMKIMQKSGSFHYYPGQVALQLAKQEKIEEAITMAQSIETNKYPKHRDAAFAAIALVMARQGKAERARKIAEQNIKEKDLQNITKHSIEKVATLPDADRELEKVVTLGWSSYHVEPLLKVIYPHEYCLDLLYKPLIEYRVGLAFN